MLSTLKSTSLPTQTALHLVHYVMQFYINRSHEAHTSQYKEGVQHVATSSTLTEGCASGIHIQYTPANSSRLCTRQPHPGHIGYQQDVVQQVVRSSTHKQEAVQQVDMSSTQLQEAVQQVATSSTQQQVATSMYTLVACCTAGSHIHVHTSHQQQVATSSTGTGKTWQRGQIRSVNQLNSLLTKNCIG